VDPNVVVLNAKVRSGVILIAATPSVASQAATADFQNAVVLSVVLNAVRDVARGVVIQCAATQCVVIQCAATQCVRYAVGQCVADRDARVDSQDEVLPNDGQGVSLVDLLSLVAVQSEGAQDAALFSVQLPV